MTMSQAAPTDGTPELAGTAPSPELNQLLQDIATLAPAARTATSEAADLKALEEVRVAFLGKKGRFAEFMARLGSLSPTEKPIAGKLINNHKADVIHVLDERREALEGDALKARLAGESIDVTMPGSGRLTGHVHPVVQTIREVEALFRSLGFRTSQSPEIETHWVNFEALNIPADHPARDMQDTFFTERGCILRTHTSGNQIRTMMSTKPPMAVVCTGKVYRVDSDVTHSPMFFQMEGFLVDRNVTMGHLKGVLTEFVHGFYGPETKTRFRPSFFPFTEPSAEVDVSCVFCKGNGCRICSGTGWIEILGCGMIHPAVFENVGYDPQEWSGFAFGMGLDRLTMLKHGITDIRLLYENDLRFLEQF